MKSIRRRLILWLVPGFLLLWLLGGLAIFIMYRASEVARVDGELEVAARSVRLMLAAESADDSQGRGRGPRRGRVRLTEFDDPASGYYYHVWEGSDPSGEKSLSLGERSLKRVSFEEELLLEPHTAVLEDGEVVRQLFFRGGDGVRGGARRGKGASQRQVATVALSLTEMNRSLSRLIVGMVMTGLVGAVLSSALIAWALRNGLRPLEWLVGEVATITPGTLFTRFESDGVPMEIEPVVQHVNGLLERLEEGFHRERRFNADLAHELRTPLAEIRSLIELGIRFPSEVNESQQQDILASSRRMERMVSAMLLLAQCEEAQPAQGEETSSTKILLEECWQTHTAVAERRNVQLKCEIHQDAVLNGNGDLWRHLIGNLLSNAAAYAPEGSVVLVKDGPGFLLEISNVAPDLSEEDLGAMFDRLWRGDRARTGDEHCGLGLSIVQACADALWVRVEVSLSPNSDLTFRLSERREVS